MYHSFYDRGEDDVVSLRFIGRVPMCQSSPPTSTLFSDRQTKVSSTKGGETTLGVTSLKYFNRSDSVTVSP